MSATKSTVQEIITRGGQVQVVDGTCPLYIWCDGRSEWIDMRGEVIDSGVVALVLAQADPSWPTFEGAL